MSKRHLKILRSLTRPKSINQKSFKNTFKQTLRTKTHEALESILPEKILDEAKYFWFKNKNWNYLMPTFFSLLLVCILVTYQNCGGGVAGSPLAGVTKELSAFEQSIEGEKYFAELINSTTGKKYLLRMDFRSNGHFEGRIVRYDSTQYVYQENTGAYEFLSNGKVKITYDYETCDPVGSEEFTLKKGDKADTVILQTEDKTEFVLYKEGSYLLPSYALDVLSGEEDKSCSMITSDDEGTPVEIFAGHQSSSMAYNSTTIDALNLYASKFQCQRRPSVVYNTQTGYNANTVGGQFQIGPLAGDAGTSYVGVSQFKDIIVVTKILRSGAPIGFNVEVSYCAIAYSQTGILVTPPSFTERNISAFSAQMGITLYEKITQGVGSLVASQTVAYVDAYQSYPPFYLYTTFGDASYSLSY